METRQRPDDGRLRGGKMQQGRRIRKGDTLRASHRVLHKFGGRILHRPGRVMNFAPIEMRFMHGIQTVALDQIVFQRTGLCLKYITVRSVTDTQTKSLRLLLPSAVKTEPLFAVYIL